MVHGIVDSYLLDEDGNPGGPGGSDGLIGNILLFATGGARCWYSTDGENFSAATGLSSGVFFAADSDGVYVWAMTSGHDCYRSDDGGVSWSMVYDDITGGIGGSFDTGGGSEDNLRGYFGYVEYLDRLLVLLDTGFGWSDDAGDSWTFEEWSTNHDSTYEKRYTFDHSGDRIVATAYNGSTEDCIYSTDGENWSQATVNSAGEWYATHYSAAAELFYAIGRLTSNNRVNLRTSADGTSWAGQYTSGLFGRAYAMAEDTDNDRIIASIVTDFLYTESAGAVWLDREFQVLGGGGARFDLIFSRRYNRFYMGDSTGLLTSADGADQGWTNETPGVNGNITCIVEV